METSIHSKKFAALSREVNELVKQQSWYSLHGAEVIKFLARFALFIAGFGVFLAPHIITRLMGLIVMSYAFTGIAISGIHEASHKSFAKHKWANKVWAYIFTEFWTAKSHDWWNFRHIETHHPHPNDPVKEPKPFYYPWMNPYVYFFLVPYLVQFWIIINSVKFLWGKWAKMVIYLVIAAFGLMAHSSLFMAAGFSIPIALLLTIVMRSFFAPQFMHLAVFNHIGLTNPETTLPWIQRQTITTRNIQPNWFLSGLGGNAFLDGHLEHHLFPSLSNNILKKVRPLILKAMNVDEYPYITEGYFSCLKHCIDNYHQLFQDLPHPLW